MMLSILALTAVLAHAILALSTSSRDDPDATVSSAYCSGLEEETILTYGDVDDGGPGFYLRDSDIATPPPHYFFLYEDARDTHPWKYALMNPNTEVFISLCLAFQGRIIRGDPAMNLDGKVHNLGTWVELSLEGPPSPNAWADISLLQGCDGAATVAAMDGSNVTTGFTGDLITGAPAAVLRSKTNDAVAIAKTVGEGASDAARDYELSLLDPTRNASIVDQYKPAIKSGNGRFLVTMYYGTY